MIKAIIFDLGGVVLKHSYESVFAHLAKPFAISAQKSEKLYQTIKKDWSLGKIDVYKVADHYMKSLSTSTMSPAKIIKIWIKAHEDETEFNKKVLNLIKKLKRNYKVYLLTNTMDLHYNVIGKKGIYKYFDKVYTSFELGKRKPNKDIYKHLLSDTHLKPGECVFIDDKEENVETARKLKIKGIVFINYHELLFSLKKLNIIF